MRKISLRMALFAGVGLLISTAFSQPPEGKEDKKEPAKEGDRKGPPAGGKKGPPKFVLGKVLPPHVMEGLDLTTEQEKQLAELEKLVKAKLEKILTADQIKQIEQMGPPGPPGGRGGKEE